MRWAMLLVILITWGSGFNDLEASPSGQRTTWSENEANQEAMLAYLKPILKSAGRVARIYYLGPCKKYGDYYAVSFPHVRVLPPSRSSTAISAVRDIFRNDDNIDISDGPDGIIRIVIGRPPVALLKTKLAILTFDQSQRYTESLALWRIMDNKEVDDVERKLHFYPDGPPLRISLGENSIEGAPHLPASMTNLTVDQALDSVAKNFGVMVLYGVCTEKHFYTIYHVALNP
ncbi:hypothetical protein I6J77_01360 [Rhodanobacter sp. FDAARGOS 1247]|uniref:hypothetical protein n=1 Tax=Rhodanobacter sp. FDAARGOS 1247 TaxID=2778082 RepID=UPI00195194F0|nr:hypothetical protein [Rhodanobacter sp. FDAARGOS 1247]QRP64146.1 hypothetical protein I6J77_01360 [Rhodanobacter sp. FDAARGOS 1247]